MPRKPESVVASNVIKWTEEEWQAIAARVLEEKGRALLHSPQLEEVKAKDVFHAQNVLPESRHRKLISISQGFQAIRQRLSGILQSLEPVPQHDLFAAPTTADNKESAMTEVTLVGQPTLQSADTPDEVAQQETQAINATPPVTQAPAPAAKTVSKIVVSIGETTQPAGPVSAPPRVHAKAKMVHPSPRQQSPLALARSQSGGGDLIELARPFVAMVCQEFANALVKTMLEKGGTQDMASMLQAALPGVIPSSAPQHDHRSAARSLDNRMPDSDTASPAQANYASDDDDAHFADDVQPLFDPKLPPSANSSFKPEIALIATGTRDFEDLKQFYPQLELNVVALENLGTAPSLRNCQRMIGLREDVPVPADEFLRKTFGSRYVRITGGITQIREQLNAWLNNPGTMNASAHDWPRKQGNGKGQGNGYPKKKPFRRPRPAA